MPTFNVMGCLGDFGKVKAILNPPCEEVLNCWHKKENTQLSIKTYNPFEKLLDSVIPLPTNPQAGTHATDLCIATSPGSVSKKMAHIFVERVEPPYRV